MEKRKQIKYNLSQRQRGPEYEGAANVSKVRQTGLSALYWTLWNQKMKNHILVWDTSQI